jgi:VWFA-related protein
MSRHALRLAVLSILLAAGALVWAQEPGGAPDTGAVEPGTTGAGSPDVKAAEPGSAQVGAAADAASQDGAEGAQSDESSEPKELFIDRVDVNVVNIEVYVTDKKGNRVTGLTKDDFELYEDKRPVQITNFLEVRGGERVGSPEERERVEPLPTRTEMPGAFRASDVPEEQRLHLVVYVDNFNIRPINRNRILGDLRRFLIEKLRSEDRVMVVSYDRALHVRQGFTSDMRLAAKSTLELEMLTGSAVSRDSERRQALDMIEEAQSRFEAQSAARSYAQSVENDLTFTLRSLREIVDSLAGLPGRKMILYVSDGIPWVAGQDLYLAIDQKFTGEGTSVLESLNFDFSRKYQQLVDSANAGGVSFYTLDSQGLQVSSSVSAEERGRQVGFFADSSRQQNLQVPLRFMATETGGKAILNTNATFDALEQVAEDFTHYYSLGYQPAHFGDGRYYRLDVKVKDRKGVDVRHREGYRDLSADRRMNDGTYAALYYNFQSNPLDVELEFERGKRRNDGFYLVPIRVRVPLGKLALVPREDTYEGRIRVWVGALDEHGTSPIQQVPVPISIPADEIDHARQQDYVYSITLLLRSGEQKVAVGVRDDLAAETAFITRRVVLQG